MLVDTAHGTLAAHDAHSCERDAERRGLVTADTWAMERMLAAAFATAEHEQSVWESLAAQFAAVEHEHRALLLQMAFDRTHPDSKTPSGFALGLISVNRPDNAFSQVKRIGAHTCHYPQLAFLAHLS